MSHCRLFPTLLPLLAVLLCPGAAPSARPRLVRPVRPYDVHHYRLLVQLDPRTGAFRTRTAITFVATQPMSELALDAVGLSPGGAWLADPSAPLLPPDQAGKGAPLPVRAYPDRDDEARGTLLVALPLRLMPGSEATVEVVTSGKPGPDQNGLFAVTDPDAPRRGPLYVTHFEPLGARRFFPCHDDPADKATFDVTVETSAQLEVLMNGRRVSSIPVSGGRRRVRYAMVRPMSTYLLALVAGPLDHDTLDEGGVPLDAYFARGRKDAARYALAVAQGGLLLFERLWGVPYPFERYGQVESPSFPAGAMENSSLTFSAREAMLLPAPDAQLTRLRVAGTVSHELAHQWFGDLVTMEFWDDVWLSEALATYAGGLAMAERFGDDLIAVRTTADLHDGYFRTENGPRSHPILNQELRTLEDAFDPITYTKGAQVLGMIEELLGPERMRAGLSAYLRQHAYGSASTGDLLAALAAAQTSIAPPRRAGPVAVPDTPLTEFARSWLQARGYPVLTVSSRYDPAHRRTLLTVRQRPNRPADSTRWHVRLPVVLHRRGTERFHVEALLALPPTGAPVNFAVPTRDAPEWISWNRGGRALAEIEAPGTTEATWALAAGADPDPTTRLLALLQLLAPALSEPPAKAAPLSPVAEEALAQALEGDPSAAVRYEIAQRLARARVSLGKRLAQAALTAAREPAGVDPADPLAVMMARAGAIELCGRVPGPEAEALLSQLIQDHALPIDLLGPTAAGLARRGTDSALQALQRGVQVQRARGLAYAARVQAEYGALANPQHLSELVRMVRQGLSQGNLSRQIVRRLFDNEDLRQSPQFPAAVADLVLGSPQMPEDQQARALRAIEGLRTKEAREALQKVKQQAKSARVRVLAGVLLE